MPLSCKRHSRFNKTFNFSPTKVFGFFCKLGDLYVICQAPPVPHAFSVNVNDLLSAFFVRQANLDLNLKSSWSQKSRINHIEPIGHSNKQHIIQRVYPINFCQQLIDQRVTNPCAVTSRATFLTNRINLVKDNNMKFAIISSRKLFAFCISKQFTHILFCFPNKLAQNLRTRNNLRLSRMVTALQHFANLSRNKSFTTPRRTIQHKTTHMLDP
mmetsp:Transcript_6570/g.10354  ORF Transcript_6570/g.10354 Transcript_6570/m.10354 type:complete len:213 (+) Transcript_6570:967-1605(+)